MAAAALRKDDAIGGPAPPLGRAETLARYRHLRAIAKRHHAGAMALVSGDALTRYARALGLTVGKTLVLDDMDDMVLPVDLAIHTAPPERTRAIDRYADAARCAPGADEGLVLAAMRAARFAVLQVERRRETAGLVVRDMVRGSELWLIDEGLEQSMPDGLGFATRYFALDDFIMTAGIALPVTRDAITRAFDVTPALWRKEPVDAIQDRRFAQAIYRAAIEDGTARQVAYRDVGGEGEAAAIGE